MEKFTCPCCGYKTLDEQFSWDICPICYWEDDPLQFEEYLINKGYKQITLRGKPSTVYDYIKRIDRVCQ